MTLAIFDLDNTLIAGDSDHLWGDFLVERGIVDGDHYKATNDRFYQDYVAGKLDIHAYLRFALAVLAQHPLAQLHAWRDEFMAAKVEPILLDAAFDLIARHRDRGDYLLIITATNDFVTAPIAERLGVHALIATRAAMHNGVYTGEVEGIPCYRDGKVDRLNAWLADAGAGMGESLEGSYFYSDSHNDMPLLTRVTHPVAVDPDDVLRREAQQRGWPEITLRS